MIHVLISIIGSIIRPAVFPVKSMPGNHRPLFEPYRRRCKIEAMNIESFIAKNLSLSEKQVHSALSLLEEGATIPFIARYRKEQTGELDEDALRAIEQAWNYQNSLEKRKESIRAILDEKKLLSDSVAAAIQSARTLAELEEVYRPFKEKRKTKASEAIVNGFGPLAERLWKQKSDPHAIADESQLEQAGYILAEKISEMPEIRSMLRDQIQRHENLCSTVKKDAQDPQGVFETYYDFSNPLRSIPGYRTLAMERGEKEKVLTVTVSSDNDRLEEMVCRRLLKNGPARAWLQTVVHDALIRLLLPSIKREIRASLREKAYEKAIAGFASNLEHLLMMRPIKGQSVLSWDPGYRNGCKLAMLDPNGEVLETLVVFPFLHGSEIRTSAPFYRKAIADTRRLLDQYHPSLIVIGNGTASRESADLIAALLEDYPDVSYVIGSEAGASVYSASELAREEFPDLPVEKRSAISIGRRIQDPLSELVKIDPQSLGIGEYQHDVPQKQLRETLDFITDKAVNRVGVNVNTASSSLLRHVSGLKKPQIAKIVKARQIHPFTSRQQLSGLLSEKIYEQSIGFLRIPGASSPLDNTGIHPESYDLTCRLLESTGLDLNQIHDPSFKQKLSRLRVDQLCKTLQADRYTIEDILKELASPGLDPRDSLDGPVLKKGVLKLEDLKENMELRGTVRNVTSFGAFVDIGLHEDGLVHISRMAKKFVKDPAEIVHTGQIVTVYVVETDLRRRRISLSLVPLQ